MSKAFGGILALLVMVFTVGIAVALFIDTALLVADEYLIAALIAIAVVLAMILGTHAAREERV
jgi:hypothetical protein